VKYFANILSIVIIKANYEKYFIIYVEFFCWEIKIIKQHSTITAEII